MEAYTNHNEFSVLLNSFTVAATVNLRVTKANVLMISFYCPLFSVMYCFKK